MLAEHFQTMYKNLNINIDSELEQLKVRETTAKVHIFCCKAFAYEDNQFAWLLTDFGTFFRVLVSLCISPNLREI